MSVFQVQVIVPGGGSGLLQYDVGEILTVLDKHEKNTLQGGGTLWSGVNSQGKVGWFHPSHTVTYLGNLPGAGGVAGQWSSAPPPDSAAAPAPGPSIFQRTGLRGSKDRGSRRKISRDMISGPTGAVQHTGHVGPDGCFFGDVTFISGTNGNLTIGGRLPSTGSDNGFPSWSKADSDASESAPLISSSRPGGEKPTAQPRMGHAIGYLRRPEREEQAVQPAHQYHSISDEENEAFGGPLDLGPSLLDEVFSELENYDTLKLGKEEAKPAEEENHALHGLVESCHKLADKVTTLTLSRRHKGKKAAFVRPIKASDERTLENAIIMANQIASKSMHDLDKRCTDDMFNASPQVSPITPNSPSKKFTFKFPTHGKHRSSSPSRHFTDEANSRNDINSMITPTARDAYKALVDGDLSADPFPPAKSAPSPAQSFHRLSLPPTASIFSQISTAPEPTAPSSVYPPDPPPTEDAFSNPLPLPPKDRKSSVTAGKRHIRKNPLIIPSGASASMVRRVEDDYETETFVPRSKPGSRLQPTLPTQSSAPVPPNPVSSRNNFDTYNDAFEDEIACSIDALDNIPESRHSSPKTSLDNQNNYGTSPRVESRFETSPRTEPRYSGAENFYVGRGGRFDSGGVQDPPQEQRYRSRRGIDSDEVGRGRG